MNKMFLFSDNPINSEKFLYFSMGRNPEGPREQNEGPKATQTEVAATMDRVNLMVKELDKKIDNDLTPKPLKKEYNRIRDKLVNAHDKLVQREAIRNQEYTNIGVKTLNEINKVITSDPSLNLIRRQLMRSMLNDAANRVLKHGDISGFKDLFSLMKDGERRDTKIDKKVFNVTKKGTKMTISYQGKTVSFNLQTVGKDLKWQMQDLNGQEIKNHTPRRGALEGLNKEFALNSEKINYNPLFPGSKKWAYVKTLRRLGGAEPKNQPDKSKVKTSKVFSGPKAPKVVAPSKAATTKAKPAKKETGYVATGMTGKEVDNLRRAGEVKRENQEKFQKMEKNIKKTITNICNKLYDNSSDFPKKFLRAVEANGIQAKMRVLNSFRSKLEDVRDNLKLDNENDFQRMTADLNSAYALIPKRLGASASDYYVSIPGMPTLQRGPAAEPVRRVAKPEVRPATRPAPKPAEAQEQITGHLKTVQKMVLGLKVDGQSLQLKTADGNTVRLSRKAEDKIAYVTRNGEKGVFNPNNNRELQRFDKNVLKSNAQQVENSENNFREILNQLKALKPGDSISFRLQGGLTINITRINRDKFTWVNNSGTKGEISLNDMADIRNLSVYIVKNPEFKVARAGEKIKEKEITITGRVKDINKSKEIMNKYGKKLITNVKDLLSLIERGNAIPATLRKAVLKVEGEIATLSLAYDVNKLITQIKSPSGKSTLFINHDAGNEISPQASRLILVNSNGEQTDLAYNGELIALKKEIVEFKVNAPKESVSINSKVKNIKELVSGGIQNAMKNPEQKKQLKDTLKFIGNYHKTNGVDGEYKISSDTDLKVSKDGKIKLTKKNEGTLSLNV